MSGGQEPLLLIHSLRADEEHWIDVWNFSLAGTRSSIGLADRAQALVTPCEVDLAVLSGPPQDWPPMFLSGFLVTVRLGAMVREGLRLGRGVWPYPTRWATGEGEQRILANADREIALERGRRLHAPTAPSRLCCLWLAEDTTEERHWVGRMMVRVIRSAHDHAVAAVSLRRPLD